MDIKLKRFEFEGISLAAHFLETQDVKEGVVCDVYSFENDIEKDLAIIKIKQGFSTPLQRILQGDKTIEGFISGKGKLVVTKDDGSKQVYDVDDKTTKLFSVTVGIGDLMQWQADKNCNLIAYEVCFPPYKDGRFENL